MVSELKVVVSSPSHVHAGNYDINGGLGRLYGTVGMALESPRYVVEVAESKDSINVRGDGRRDEAARFARAALREARRLGCKLGGLEVVIAEEIPAHVGLGSTTALALSIAYGVFKLCGIEPIDPVLLAKVTGRGRYSALGVYSFSTGGFIVDGGFRPQEGGVPPLVFRAHVPRRISVIVALPERPIPEIRKIKEREWDILEALPRMSEEMAMWASREVLVGVMANIADGLWEEAFRHLHRFNEKLGGYWRREQGGIYCCREVSTLIESAVEAGAWAACQSSWGPATYVVVDSRRVREMADVVRGVLDRFGGGRIWVTRVDNEGAWARVLD